MSLLRSSAYVSDSAYQQHQGEKVILLSFASSPRQLEFTVHDSPINHCPRWFRATAAAKHQIQAPHLSERVTCQLLHWLQPHTDGLVGEQRRGGQRARHALHYADVLHALRHGERRHGVVPFEGTVAVYAATCRTGGSKALNARFDRTSWAKDAPVALPAPWIPTPVRYRARGSIERNKTGVTQKREQPRGHRAANIPCYNLQL